MPQFKPILVAVASLATIAHAQQPQPPQPWLTGPLIAPIGPVVPYGHFDIESYLYFTAITGVYNKSWEAVSSPENFYSLSLEIPFFLGLTSWCDINITPQISYNMVSNQSAFNFGDLTVGFDFQLLGADFTPYFPGILLSVREVFPTGDFQYLQPRKLGANKMGGGTFATQFDLIFYKVFHLSGLHWMSATLSAQYTVNTSVDVHGFNVYGGGFGTRGTARPGDNFQGILSFEYSLTQNWALALDNVYTYTKETQFCGIPGISYSGTLAEVGCPSSEQFSIAPAIEYNFSSEFGIIGGCWFSILGRNSAVFQSGIVNIEYGY